MDNIDKEVASRIELLGRIQINYTPAISETIFKVVMILLAFLYSSYINISLSDSQSSKIEKLQHRAIKILIGHHGRITFPAKN